jgi:chromosome segregation protein
MQDLSGRMEETRTAREQIARERARIAQDRKKLESEQAVSGQDLQKSDASEKQENDRIEALQAQLDQLGTSLASSEENLSKVRMKLAGYAQEMNFISQNLDRLAQEVENRSKEAQEITQRMSAGEAEKEEKRLQVEELKAQIAKTKQKEEELAAGIAAMNADKEEKLTLRKSFFDRREELSGEITRLDRETFRLEEQLKKLEEGREKSIEYLWEEYDLTPVQCKELRREDLGPMTALKKRLADIRREIKALGSVNVGAIEQYKEVAERYEFLSAQHEDLVKSAADLGKIIDQLDDSMRTQFREQFERMRKEYDVTFRDLFGGGKGTLELVEEEDILEAGIRVIAQPPGKKLQNMMQLSGGEKSLAAIALLFAIQNLKPSPFCLLDEIESALDEANVDRFARYLHKLTKHTQFIIITHRRGSMASCDRLYGITMQEKGVSALVSVDLVENELT